MRQTRCGVRDLPHLDRLARAIRHSAVAVRLLQPGARRADRHGSAKADHHRFLLVVMPGYGAAEPRLEVAVQQSPHARDTSDASDVVPPAPINQQTHLPGACTDYTKARARRAMRTAFSDRRQPPASGRRNPPTPIAAGGGVVLERLTALKAPLNAMGFEFRVLVRGQGRVRAASRHRWTVSLATH